MQYFDKNEGKIVSCGLNFPYIIDGAPGEKTAYGYSSFLF